jgi:hypothetical protein
MHGSNRNNDMEVQYSLHGTRETRVLGYNNLFVTGEIRMWGSKVCLLQERKGLEGTISAWYKRDNDMGVQ